MLLLTLLILALAVTVIAQVSRSSFARAAESVRAEHELQQRWAALSCRKTYLPRAEQIIASGEAARGSPLATWRATVVLSGQKVDLVFADETAKLNVNLLVHRRGKAAAETAVRELTRSANSDVRPRLLAGKPQAVRPKKSAREASRTKQDSDGGDAQRPSAPLPFATGGTPSLATVPDEVAEEAYPLQSFGQVFPETGPAALAGFEGRPAAAAWISCWGDGRLHFRRASDAVLRQFGPPTLTAGQINRLIRIRQELPGVELAEAVDQLKLDEDAQAEFEERLDEASDCHSLWVVVTTPERSWYYFAIDDGSSGSQSALLFAW